MLTASTNVGQEQYAVCKAGPTSYLIKHVACKRQAWFVGNTFGRNKHSQRLAHLCFDKKLMRGSRL